MTASKNPAPNEPSWITDEEAQRRGIDEASKNVKRLAAQQPVTIRLTTEQMEALRSQWVDLENGRPAEITFEVDGSVTGKLRVAAYGYFSDTCCA